VEGFAGIARGQISVDFKSARPGHASVPTADNRGLATGPTGVQSTAQAARRRAKA
jgi:hypothetical protein